MKIKEAINEVTQSSITARQLELLTEVYDGVITLQDLYKVMYNVIGLMFKKNEYRIKPEPTKLANETDKQYANACRKVENENEGNIYWGRRYKEYAEKSGLTMNDWQSEWYDYVIGQSNEKPVKDLDRSLEGVPF